MSIASGLEEVSIAWSDKPGSRQGGSICSNSRGAHALMSKFSSTFNVSINKLAPCTLFVSAVIVRFSIGHFVASVIMFLIVLCWQPDSMCSALSMCGQRGQERSAEYLNLTAFFWLKRYSA